MTGGSSDRAPIRDSHSIDQLLGTQEDGGTEFMQVTWRDGAEAATWRSRLHFDTTQFPHVFWSSPAEWRKKVLARIRANAWDEPHMPGSK